MVEGRCRNFPGPNSYPVKRPEGEGKEIGRRHPLYIYSMCGEGEKWLDAPPGLAELGILHLFADKYLALENGINRERNLGSIGLQYVPGCSQAQGSLDDFRRVILAEE